MRSTLIAVLATWSAFLFFTGCTYNGNVIKVDHTNFTDEIVPDQNLVFSFVNTLAPDSLLNQWDTTAYISFTPAVKGKFKWSSPTELIFSPLEPFAPSTEFTASLSPELTKHSKEKPALPKENTIKFHTPFLTMATAQVFWALSSQNAGAVEVRLNMNFNCKVKPADLNKRLHVFVNEKEVPFDILTGDPDYTIGVSVADVRGESKESIPLKIGIDPGLPCVGSTYVTKDKMEFAYEVPAKEKIMVVQMTASFIQGEGVVSVFTNQPVINENLKSLLTISPTLPFTIEKKDNGFNLKGDFEPDKNYEITILKDLRGVFGFTLDEAYTQTVSFGELDPALSFANGNAMYLSSRGSRNIAVNIVSINKVKVSYIRIYENNILNFIRAGEQWGYEYEESEDDDYNYHDFRYYDYNDYGDLITEKTYDVQSLPKKGNLRLLNLNLEDIGYGDKFKGLYLVKVQDADHQWLQESQFVSLSDVGLSPAMGKMKWSYLPTPYSPPIPFLT
jgi:hypothetical protein